MANIKAVIDILGALNNRIDSLSSPEVINNVSKPVLYGNTTRNSGFLGYPMVRKISDGGRMISQSDGFNGYVFGYCDGDGLGNLQFTIIGGEISVVVFYFNQIANQWATEALIDEGTADEQILYSDDNIWAIKFINPLSSHTVKFTKWNKPYYSMCITHIEALANTLEFTNQWISDLNSTTQKTNDPVKPVYSVLANYGNMSVTDRDKELKDYVQDGIFPTLNFEIILYINGKQIQSHTAIVTPYEANSMTFEMELTNKLSQWNNLMYTGYTITAGTTITAYDLLVDMITTAIPTLTEPDVAEMCDTIMVNEYYQDTVEEHLKNIIIPAVGSAIEVLPDTLRISVEKICLLGQLQVYENDDGEVKFVNDRPYATELEKTNAKVIPLKMQRSSLKYEILLTNAYTDVLFK